MSLAMDIDRSDPYTYRLPKPNYLPHIQNEPIVEEVFKPLDRPSELENAAYRNKAKRTMQELGITAPKGYDVSFHYNPEMERHHFGQTHPMKPWRLTLTKGLVTAYGMHYTMKNYTARAATYDELTSFHTSDYIDFLATVAPQPTPLDLDGIGSDIRFNLGGSDCPLFEGLYNYCSLSGGASLDAARKLCTKQSDIAIAWGGGLHHAKRSEASGFCYINDIVVAILQLLRIHKRVLYIDIDVHHGDGVEEAFFSTDRVMTVSFHKYDPMNFFPGTGSLEDNGPKSEHNPGAHHAINVPLNDGITDEQYQWLFQNVISRCVDKFRPEAIVLQCGADSLAGDRLGKFNLLVQGHASCLEYCKGLGVPLIIVGGGGYTPKNVARAWAYETAVATGNQTNITQTPEIPLHTPYRKTFEYDSVLLPTIEQILGDARQNRNTQKRLQEIIQHVTEQLRFVGAAPSVQCSVIPPDLGGVRDEVEHRMKEEMDEQDEEGRKDKEEGVAVPMEH